MSKRIYFQNCVRWLAAIPLLAACASDTVPLGGGKRSGAIEVGASCRESLVLDGSAYAASQADLDAIAGCEEITGNLIVEVFAGADLAPLGALRTVGGDFQLGAYPGSTPGTLFADDYDALMRQLQEGIDDGYLSSLAGLEALETTGNLQIAHVTAASLEVFAGLRSIGRHRLPAQAGQLVLDENPNLVDLHGLQNVSGVRDLNLTYNPALQDLAGLTLDSPLQNIQILGSPQLSDLAELANVSAADSLALGDTGIRNLDDLQNLVQTNALGLVNNLELEDVDGLTQLWIAGTVEISGNPKLTHLPSFATVQVDYFRAVDNAQLRAIDFQLPPAPDGGNFIHGYAIPTGPSVFEIGRNPALQRLSVAAGLTLVQNMAIYDNASLASVDLGTLQRMDRLSIDTNPSLTRVSAGALQGVDSLLVLDNPLLSTRDLESIPTFQALMKGNAPGAAR